MKVSDLARALGVSEGMAYRMKRQGMPTDSLSAARDWRAMNLDPSRMKQHRVDGNPGTVASEVSREAPGVDMAAFDVLEDFLLADLPAAIFNPFHLAASSADAGFPISGKHALRLSQFMFNGYMTIINSGGGNYGFEIPAMLNHPPDSEGFEKLAQVIDNTISHIKSELRYPEEAGDLAGDGND